MANKLDLSLILSFVDKATAPARRVQEATRGLSARLRDTSKAMRELSQQGKQIAYLQQSARQLDKLGDEARQTAARMTELKVKIEAASAAGKSTARLERSLASLSTHSETLAGKQAELRAKVDAATAKLKAQGYDTGNLARAQQQLATRTEQTTKKLERQKAMMEAGRKVSDKLRSSLESLKTAGAWMAGISAAGFAAGGALGASALGKAAQFEQYEVMLETLEGSREQAKKSMAWVSDFTSRTPYELDQVTEAYVRLRAYGLDPTHGLLTTLGDTSAAMGKDIMQAVEAVADAITGENERLKEFGIKASTKGQVISYEYTDKRGIQRTLSVNKSDRKAIEGALSLIWNEKYGGGMERLSGTWVGIISNIKDSWATFQVAVMQSGPFERLKNRLQGVLDTIKAAKDDGRLQQWAEEVGSKIGRVFDGIESVARWLWVTVPKIVDVLKRVASAVGGWENLLWIMLALKALPLATAALHFGMLATQALNLGPALLMVGKAILFIGRAMLLNPIGLIITGIIAAIYLLWKNWDWVVENIGGGIFRLLEWFRALPDQIMGWLSGLGGKMLEVGGNIADGIANGIKAKIGAVKDSITGLGDDAVGWIKDKLGIHSPSRVFAELGGYISEGLGVGISDKAKLALQAAGRLGAMLPGALPTALAMGVTAGAAVASPAMAAHGAGAGGTTIINITVTAPAGTDGQALAKLVAQEVEKIQRGQTTRARGRLYDEV